MMTLDEILQQVRHLNTQERRVLVQQVLEMNVASDTSSPTDHHLTVYDLMAMPTDERERVVARAFAKASDEVFETFEAEDDIDFNDYTRTRGIFTACRQKIGQNNFLCVHAGRPYNNLEKGEKCNNPREKSPLSIWRADLGVSFKILSVAFSPNRINPP